MPTAAAIVTETALVTWKMPSDQVFELALENTLADVQAALEVIHLADDALSGVHMFTGGHYATSHLLALDRTPGLTGVCGSIAAVPHRHLLVVVPLNDAMSLDEVARIAPAVDSSNAAGAEPLSRDLFWVSETGIVRLETLQLGGVTAIVPPQEFVSAVVARIGTTRTAGATPWQAREPLSEVDAE